MYSPTRHTNTETNYRNSLSAQYGQKAAVRRMAASRGWFLATQCPSPTHVRYTCRTRNHCTASQPSAFVVAYLVEAEGHCFGAHLPVGQRQVVELGKLLERLRKPT